MKLTTTYTNIIYYLIIPILLFSACNKAETKTNESLFSLLDSSISNIHFTNEVKEDLYFNFLNYPYIYNGGGVASGDINNDGLEDLYFTSNQNSNKLYLNNGAFKFQDITETANVADKNGWTTGVTMIDINNDGWLDIYVCKSGSLQNNDARKNKLFINQKDNTFKESASQYGLDFYGFSVQSYFFDMDNDGDLDMYLVNHRADFRNNTTIDLKRDEQIEDYGSDQLYKNENGTFINITKSSGIANKAWSLSASIGDFNNDGWLDVFIANDFLQPDYLYINNKNGTFTDKAIETFNHISNNSMGSDFEDINNDSKPDLLVLDMMAEDHVRSKENMATMNTHSFNTMVNANYHYQYMSNTLQLNNGNTTFSEIAQLAGIAKTDWSWAPLIADFDNDGFKDVFITNGIQHDLSNQDFRTQMRQNIMNRKKVSLEQAIAMMPSEKLQNYIYKNNGDLTFTKTSKTWGLEQKTNSNGAIYTDLDNDGDLDIITNNQADKASIYKNNTRNNSISFSLKGPEQNKNGIGSIINLYTKNSQQSKTLFTSRGYQSSVSNKLHFGIKDITSVDSAEIIWPNGTKQLLTNIKANQTLYVDYKKSNIEKHIKKSNALFQTINPTDIGINYIQKENQFNDFDLQLLLPQKQSEMSSALTVGDVNNDGIEDFFVGNAKDASASLYVQNKDGGFIETNKELFELDKSFEDTNAKFIDIDNDGDLDLYVASGGYEIKEGNPLLQDRLYINNGQGLFHRGNNLPKTLVNSKSITVADYDNDGDSDIFIGAHVKYAKYPLAYPSYLLENKNGKFIDVTDPKINSISELKIINDAVFSDFDKDGDLDLIVVGEWMSITVFENNNQQFYKKEIDILKDFNGWYQTIKEIDLNNDGYPDYIVGNWGANNKFHPSKTKPLHVYADYLDTNKTFDIVLSKVSKTGHLIPVRGKECSSQQTPFINNNVNTFKAFAASTLPEIYGSNKLANATHYTAHNFESLALINNKNGGFKIQKLPIRSQFGPILSIDTYDINNDGYLDVFGVGNVFDSEVETIRYDASKGFILMGNNKGTLKFKEDSSYFNNHEAKAIKKIIINEIVHFIILNKNSTLNILKLKSS
ncbi:VCBS repeat-containing protein [uncultured Lacinutrix sp.]|uniref:VCBS repeat-containing protein n=1 Tax=uncultured Lacinutrix sp. TaxID=574032 RepID=UPI002628DE36|nr:VCBS repeat-containing protein [uncultured Lacinutrix sp.]